MKPNRISVIIKGKVLRLLLPEEVAPDASHAKRSRATSTLVLELPKLKPNGPMTYGVDASGLAPGQSYTDAAAAAAAAPINIGSLSGTRQKAGGGRKTATRQKFGDAILEAASAATKKSSSGAVTLSGLATESSAQGEFI